jgi:hypothetical protein
MIRKDYAKCTTYKKIVEGEKRAEKIATPEFIFPSAW